MKQEIINLIEQNKISTTEVADALGKTGLIPGVTPLTSQQHCVGEVVRVCTYNGSNWPLHEQIHDLDVSNKIVVVDCHECDNLAIFGDLVAKYLILYQKCRGIVCTGRVRDVHRLVKERYPIWCSGVTPIGCTNDKPVGEVPAVLINNKMYDDSIIVADDSGVVLINSQNINIKLYNKLKAIELQEDIWYYCLDTKKQSTYDIVCKKLYLDGGVGSTIDNNINRLKEL